MTFTSRLIVILIASITLVATSVNAGLKDFKPGKAIPNFGKIVDVPTVTPLAEGVVLSHSFDPTDAAKPGAPLIHSNSY